MMQFPERVVEEAPGMRMYWDGYGALRRDLYTANGWTSQWLDFTIKNAEDWARHRMRFDPSRVSEDAVRAEHASARAKNRFVCYTCHGCFHPTWMKIGMENELMLMLDRPELIADMYAAHTELAIDLYRAMRDMGLEFDGARMADDLGYHSAPLISPELYRELVLPYHRRFCDFFAGEGLKTILHSDGNVAPLIDHFLDAGFTALHPLEAKAGLDVRKLKPLYGDRLVLFGNIDVRKLAGSREDVEEEIAEKVPVARENGRYIYHSDHSVPSDVPLENYRLAMKLLDPYGTYG